MAKYLRVLFLVFMAASFFSPRVTNAQSRQVISSSDPKVGLFGASLTVSTDYMVIGAPYTSVHGKASVGAAYVLQQTEGTWLEVAKLTPSDEIEKGTFGSSVALSGEYLVVGAFNANRAYLYRRADGNWVEELIMTPTGIHASGDSIDAQPTAESGGSAFGLSVTIDGDWIAVSAPYVRFAVPHLAPPTEEDFRKGSVHLFRKQDTTWVKHEVLSPKLAGGAGRFGISVGLKGDFLAIGHSDYDDQKGTVHTYQLKEDSWHLKASLTAPGGETRDRFGASLSLSDKYLVVGAPGANHDLKSRASKVVKKIVGGLFGWSSRRKGKQKILNAGIAYVYARINGELREPQKLLPGDLHDEGNFGLSCSVNGDRVAIGSRIDRGDKWNRGWVYVFDKIDDWTQSVELMDNTSKADEVGVPVVLADAQLMAGYGYNRKSVTVYSLDHVEIIDDIERSRDQAVAWYTGIGDTMNTEKALKLFNRLVQNGDEQAFMWIEYYNFENRTTKSARLVIPKEVLKQVKKKAKKDTYADFLMGWYEAEKAKNWTKALDNKRLRRSAKRGNLMAWYQLGVLFSRSGGRKEAFECHKTAADRGNPLSMVWLGYEYSRPRYRGNAEARKLAFSYFATAGEKGHVEPLYRLAELYVAEKNYEKALELYQRSSNGGDLKATYTLGIIHYKGKYVERDFVKAHDYFSQGAKAGDNRSMYALGMLHESSAGVDKDLEMAKRYYLLSYKYGNVMGKQRFYFWSQMHVTCAKVIKNMFVLIVMAKASCRYSFGITTKIQGVTRPGPAVCVMAVESKNAWSATGQASLI